MSTTERMERVAAEVAADLGITIEEARALMKVVLHTQGRELVSALRAEMKGSK